MRAVIQRVSEARVTIEGKIKAQIGLGLLVFVGFEDEDGHGDIEWLSAKIINLRIFAEENDVPNLSLKSTGGDLLLISQFTLFATTKKGNRPGYTRASNPVLAIPLYEAFILQLQRDLGKNIFTGSFGADMKVALVNDGPVTIWIDTKNRE